MQFNRKPVERVGIIAAVEEIYRSKIRDSASLLPLYRETEQIGVIDENDNPDKRVQHCNIAAQERGDDCRDDHLMHHKSPRFLTSPSSFARALQTPRVSRQSQCQGGGPSPDFANVRINQAFEENPPAQTGTGVNPGWQRVNKTLRIPGSVDFVRSPGRIPEDSSAPDRSTEMQRSGENLSDAGFARSLDRRFADL
jgi:hypothetical protein